MNLTSYRTSTVLELLKVFSVNKKNLAGANTPLLVMDGAEHLVILNLRPARTGMDVPT